MQHAAVVRVPRQSWSLAVTKFHALSSRRCQSSAPRGRHRQLASKAPATLRIHLRNAVPAASIRRRHALPPLARNVVTLRPWHGSQGPSAHASSGCIRAAQLPGEEPCCGSQEGGDVGVLRHRLQDGPRPLDRVQQLQRSKAAVTKRCQLPSGTPAGHVGGCAGWSEHCGASQHRAASAMAASATAMGLLMQCQPGADMFEVQQAARLLPAHKLLLAAQPLLLRQVVPQLHQRLRQGSGFTIQSGQTL
jgi:hypothetical protein